VSPARREVQLRRLDFAREPDPEFPVGGEVPVDDLDRDQPAAERPADFAAQVEEIAASLTILDGALAGRSWLCGDQITIADIAFGPMMKRVLGFPIDLPALPNLRAWQGRIEARPAFQKATAA